jgi:hypothetical protein
MKYNPEKSGIRDSTVMPPGFKVPGKAKPAEWKGSWSRKKAS